VAAWRDHQHAHSRQPSHNDTTAFHYSPATTSRVLPTSLQLVPYLPEDSLRQPILMAFQEDANRIPISHSKLTKCPRKSLDHHGITILSEQCADSERSRRIAITTLSSHVQRNGTDQCCSPPPTIRGPRPSRDQTIRNPPHAPRPTRDVAREGVHFAPTLHRASQPFDVSRS
jgi:hypothetical protein